MLAKVSGDGPENRLQGRLLRWFGVPPVFVGASPAREGFSRCPGNPPAGHTLRAQGLNVINFTLRLVSVFRF